VIRDDDGLEYQPLRRLTMLTNEFSRNQPERLIAPLPARFAWQELGYWHIGRSQVMTGKYGLEDYWHNDLANTLRTNHLDITLQPTYVSLPIGQNRVDTNGYIIARLGAKSRAGAKPSQPAGWSAQLALEKIMGRHPKRLATAAGFSSGRPAQADADLDDGGDATIPVPSLSGGLDPSPSHGLGLLTAGDKEPEWLSATSIVGGPSTASLPLSEPEWMGSLDYTEDPPAAPAAPAEPAAPAATGKKAAGNKRGRPIGGGSLLKADGTSEPSMVGML
jgi:hypothetical protein